MWVLHLKRIFVCNVFGHDPVRRVPPSNLFMPPPSNPNTAECDRCGSWLNRDATGRWRRRR